MTATAPRPAPEGRRAVIVAGVRTPFVKAFTTFTRLDTIALGRIAVQGLLDRTGLDPAAVEALVWGGVILPSAAPNVAREIALDLKLPAAEGMTVSRACASGLQAITLAAAAIERGEAEVVIAGGSDSTSNAELKLPQKVVHALAPLALGGKPTPAEVMGVLAQLAPFTDILPKAPKIAERTTGETMGEAAEKMAKRNAIGREAQDDLALRSHQRAAAAMAAGRFDAELVAVQTPEGHTVHSDGLVRADTSAERLGRLKPVFDRRGGTLTAGNSSPLTDGAAAVLLMSEERARALGLKPLAALASWAYVGVDPADQLLIGPALAMPRALARAGLRLSDMDRVDLHEAFAAQVLCVLKALASPHFCRERLGVDEPVGAVDPERLNVHGGSIALGHPFGATGARMVTTMARELHLHDARYALLGICAAGGLGAAAVLERVD